jgi:hypothetical protein
MVTYEFIKNGPSRTEVIVFQELSSVLDAFLSGQFDNPRDYLTQEIVGVLDAYNVRDEDVGFHLEGCLYDDCFESSYFSQAGIDIPMGEIEIQLSDEEMDTFQDENPDWHVSGDLAYLQVLGMSQEVNVELLRQHLEEWNS